MRWSGLSLEAAIQGGAGCEIVLHFWAYLMQRKSPMNSELFPLPQVLIFATPSPRNVEKVI
jgi:hypothetical protein